MVNASTLLAFLRGSGPAAVTLVNGTALRSTLKDGDPIAIASPPTCDSDRIVAKAHVTEKSISAIFSLETNPRAGTAECTKDPLNASDANTRVAAIVAGVLVPVAVLGAGAVGVFLYRRRQKAQLAGLKRRLDNANAPQSPSASSPAHPGPATAAARREQRPSVWRKGSTASVELSNLDSQANA